MAKYRKKPVVVEAVQWNPFAVSTKNRPQAGTPDRFGVVWQYGPTGEVTHGVIQTRFGLEMVHVRDWLIKFVGGTRETMRPSDFEATYEKVED